MGQTVKIKASLGYEKAEELIRYLIDKGFSVRAIKPKDREWEINAFSDEEWAELENHNARIFKSMADIEQDMGQMNYGEAKEKFGRAYETLKDFEARYNNATTL